MGLQKKLSPYNSWLPTLFTEPFIQFLHAELGNKSKPFIHSTVGGDLEACMRMGDSLRCSHRFQEEETQEDIHQGYSSPSEKLEKQKGEDLKGFKLKLQRHRGTNGGI